jgi:flavorubredoxin
MVTYLPEEQILFSCDFFGSHLATTDIYAGRSPYVYEAAKRYYAEIMMPFKKKIQDNVDKVATNDISLIAPSHGPIYDEPGFIIDAYRDWVSDRVDNLAVVAYVSMHGSTAAMVDHMVSGLAERGVAVNEFDLAVTDIGKLAISLVDAATLVLGAPTVHFGPHPLALYAAHLVGALKPKLRYAAVIGSFGWATKAADEIEDILSKLKVELVGKHLCKGFPADEDFEALDDIAAAISTKHALLGEDSTPGEAEG